MNLIELAPHTRQPPRTSRAFWILLAISFVIHLIFLSPGMTSWDGMMFVRAALRGDWVAHPPGYVGYVLLAKLGMWLGNTYMFLVGVSVVAILAGTWLTYRLAMQIGGSEKAALLAAGAYGFSINSLYFGSTGLTHAPEGAIAGVIFLLGFKAARDRSPALALAMSAVWGAGGAIRPTTTVLLAPLWLFVLWRTFGPVLKSATPHRGKLLAWAAACVVAGVGLAMGWSRANRAGTAALPEKAPSSAFIAQAYQEDVNDFANTDLTATTQGKAKKIFVHWPFLEVGLWVEDRVGTRLIPRPEGDLPMEPPSLKRAVKFSVNQSVKTWLYILIAMPILPLAAFAAIRNRKKPSAGEKKFGVAFLFWAVVPAIGFFMFGHFGLWGYLQVILPVLAAFCAVAICRHAASWKGLPAAAGGTVLAGALVFVAARPLADKDGEHAVSSRDILNVVLLQYTGAAQRAQYSAAREGGRLKTELLPPGIKPARTEEEIRKAMRANKHLPP